MPNWRQAYEERSQARIFLTFLYGADTRGTITRRRLSGLDTPSRMCEITECFQHVIKQTDVYTLASKFSWKQIRVVNMAALEQSGLFLLGVVALWDPIFKNIKDSAQTQL